MRRASFFSAASLLWLIVATGCGTKRPAVPGATVAPNPSAYTQPPVPADLAVAPAIRQRYDAGWLRLQAGDARDAGRVFSDLLKQSPDFYPASVAIGDVALAERRFNDASVAFAAALAKNARYLPALEGRVDAALGAGDDIATASALEQLLSVDPSRDATRDRLGLIRLRIVQQQLAAAEKARAAGRLDEAQGLIDRALQASPESAVLLRELAIIEVAKGAFDSAEQHARKAVEIDSGDAEAQALLGSVLESESKIADAAVAFDRAFALDPRPAWREKRDALRARAGFEALPAEYRNLPASATVTRAQLAAMIGIELEKVVAQAPRKTTAVVTDVRSHWAASWILPVTQAGLMDVLPNHTFQPNAIVRRSDLAQAVSQTLSVIGAVRSVNIAAWTAARPRLDDVPPGHVSYRAIATALAAGAMKVDDGGRFWPSRPATGAEVVAAVARLKQLAK